MAKASNEYEKVPMCEAGKPSPSGLGKPTKTFTGQYEGVGGTKSWPKPKGK